MAERRMFAKSIVLSDAFLDMPMSARCLYFTLGMLADDDGFCGNPKAIMRQCGASQDDIKVLIEKRYVLAFESGVIVIKHWRMNNYLQNDRHKKTTYIEELSGLAIDDKGAYTEAKEPMYTECIQNVYTGKDSIGKYSIDKRYIDGESETPTSAPKESKHKYGEYNHVLLKDSELSKLKEDLGDDMTQACITFLDEYIEMKGYSAKSHYLCILKWVRAAVVERKSKNRTTKNNKFSNIPSSGYDMDDLEQKLLSRPIGDTE